ncbi:hypothetical protein KC324_g20195, partial [Hortaea werneckii]
MSEIKGISLRRKKTARPTISAPRQISQPSIVESRDRSQDSRGPPLRETQTNGSGNGNLTVPGREPRPGLGGGDKTSDLVKRRYSTRFVSGVQAGQFSDGGLAPPVPAMPSLPAQYARGKSPSQSRSPQRDGRSPERAYGPGRLRVNPTALGDAGLEAPQYVQSILSEATEDDIQAYQQELTSLKAHTSAELQHNVYQNRTQFIKISKEADKLKSEMKMLRGMMSELTGALGHATSAAGGPDANGPTSAMSLADRKRANRSSVANLEALWSTHLQALWKRVEGSQ